MNFQDASLVSNISHELRTPVNVILGFSKLLSDQSYSQEQKDFFIKEINHNSKELLRIVDRLIYSADLDNNEITPNMEICKVGEILSELQSHVNNQLLKLNGRKKKVSLINPDIPLDLDVFTDLPQLINAISHVIENRLKRNGNGSIEYGILPESKQLVLFVAEKHDSSISKNLSRLIRGSEQLSDEPEYNIDPDIDSSLAVADKIINKLGRKLRIKTKLGKESSFYFTIPLLVEKPV